MQPTTWESGVREGAEYIIDNESVNIGKGGKEGGREGEQTLKHWGN
jgi:hypothetical protein